ncbi:MAG TPA: SRPBCC family protein [Solirubrobacterales bacterium]|nr:SRPBCC family protein [Solirubrobacterales bacterium]
MADSRQAERGAADYGREALAQWADAARYGFRALRHGDAADLPLAKLGSRLVERIGGGGKGEGADPDAAEGDGVAAGNGVGAGAPLPIQGSIDVALPVAAVFDLCTRFEEFPQIVDRVSAVEIEDDTHFTVLVRVGKREHELSVELLDEQPEERLDWECAGELEHSGVLTFHPLAPRLTRLELTIERASEGPLEHLVRFVGLPERVLGQELRRFKAVAELWEDGKEYEPAEIGSPAESESPEQGEEPEGDEGEEEEETEKGT